MNKKELKKAYEEGLIDEVKFKQELFNLEISEKKVKRASRIYDSLTEEEFAKLLEHTKKTHHKICLILAYGSGLRVSEITHLQKEDILFKLKRIHVREGKGSKDRYVNIPKWFKQDYLNYIPFNIKERTLEAMFLRNSYKAGINKQIGSFKRKNKEVPIHRLHFHCLRHSFATRALDKGVPVHQVQILLGHNNLATTSKYTKSNPTDAIQSILDAGL